MGVGVDRVDWVQATLGEIVWPIRDGSHNPPKPVERGLPMISARNISEGRITFDEFRFIAEDDFLREDQRTQIKPNDVLLTIVGAIGRAAAVFEVHPRFTVQRSVAVLKPIGFDARFLVHSVHAPSTQRWLQASARGTAQKGVYLKTLAALPVSLAPLVEQCAIVAKIEALFSELDKGVEQLETIKGQLKRYRQSVLKAAFDGKLTAEWRAERARPFVQKNCEQLMVAETPATYGTKKHPPLTEDELAELPDLPEGWRWVRLGAVAENSGGLTKNSKRDQLPMRLPYLRVANVYSGELRLSEMKEIGLTENERDKTLLREGDLLFVEGNGSADQIGRVAMWNGSVAPCVHQNHIIRCRPLNRDLSEFLMYWFLSPEGRGLIMDQASSTSGLHTLSINKVTGLALPLAPLPEQHQIVAEIEARFSALDQLEQTVEAGLRQAEALRQSILKKAFEGRLLSASERAAVRADPAYEPAAKLLERIRAERAAQSGQGGQCGRATKKCPVSTAATPSTVSTPPTPKRRACP